MLDIALLGEQVLRNAEGAVRLRSARTLGLVAFLALHAGTPQSRQRLAATFWPDSTDEQALTNLRRELHHLRQALAHDPSIVVTARDLCWRDSDSCRVDVRTFALAHAAAKEAAARGEIETALAHARAAIDAYRGELLPGSYDDWVLDARSDLEQRCVDLLDLILDRSVEAGDLRVAADAARRRIQYRPLEEVGYRRLIYLQGDLGDRAGAVSTYHHCASVLERALGVAPDAATRKALDRVLARTESVPAPVPPPAPMPGRSGIAAARLIGRTGELGLLYDAWRAAATGHPRLVLVHGDAGVGKTRLVGELAEAARSSGAVVASAQCFGSAGELALSPVADWLRTPAVRSALRSVDPVWRLEVERLVPSAKGRIEPSPSLRAMVDAWQRHRFFEGLARALLAVERPLLLLLDNVHWCDQETLAFLTFMLGIARDAPVMAAGTLRDDGHQPALTEWMSRMRASAMLTEIPLAPLDAAGTVALAEALSGRTLAPQDADLLQATTGGFPLYIVEATRADSERAAGEQRPGDLNSVLRTRLEQVSAPAREVAVLAAAVGRNFTLDLLTEASDLEADAVVTGVDELWRHRILRELGDGYDFSHDLLRDAAYAAISPARRWLLHRRIAQSIELMHADDPDSVSAQLAEQYARGGRADRAVAYYRRAADVAARRFAHAEAIRLQEEALALVRARGPGRTRDEQELASLESMTAPMNALYGYAHPRLREVLERSIALAEALGRRESLLSALVGLWASQFVQGYALDAHRTATRALTLERPGSEYAGAVRFVVGGSAVSLGRPAEALQHLEDAATLGGASSLTIGTRADVHGLAFEAHAHWLLGEDAKARACNEKSITLARTADTPYSLAVALAYAAVTDQFRGDVAALESKVAELRELCERFDFAYYREWGLILDGWTQGDAAGLAAARRGVDNLAAQGCFARMPYWQSLVADLAQRTGQPELARARLDGALAAGAARNDLWWLPEVMRLRARYDDGERAVARLHQAADLATAQGSVALADRCAADLAARSVRRLTLGVRTES